MLIYFYLANDILTRRETQGRGDFLIFFVKSWCPLCLGGSFFKPLRYKGHQAYRFNCFNTVFLPSCALCFFLCVKMSIRLLRIFKYALRSCLNIKSFFFIAVG
jgi:hypothetical protein